MSELTQYERDSLNKLGQSIQEGKWSNAGLVQLIELSGCFLNIKTIPDYAICLLELTRQRREV